jgi:ribonuclease HI
VTLPAEIQAHVDAIRALLGVPPCQIVLDLDRQGVVQAVEPRVIFRRERTKEVDKQPNTSA